jgi:hypothetical protein
MTSHPSAHHTPAEWRAKAAMLAAIAALGAVTIPAAAASAAPAAAVLAGLTIHEHHIPVASGNARTTVPSLAQAAGQARPARYRYQTVALPGYPSVYVNGISDSGTYAGEACKDRDCTKLALFAASPAGKITFYALPFANYSPTGPFNASATGMDNAGDVVGAYTDAKGGLHGFVRMASGVLAEINDPLAADIPGGGTVADGISPDGSIIVGFYVGKAEVEHGFLLRDGRFGTYDVPGAVGTVVSFDNDGEFGGSYVAADGVARGFYVIHGRLHTIGAPAEPGARHPAVTVSAADAEGTVFGYVDSANLPGYGFAYANGRYTTFRDPNQAGAGPQAGTVIYNANSDGVVVGAYTYTNGTAEQLPYAEGFIARPDGSVHRARHRGWASLSARGR